jgi:hypothetical protein
MKTFSLFIILVLFGMLTSCVTKSRIGDIGLRPINTNENIIGNVQVTFTTQSPRDRLSINNIAYAMLLVEMSNADFPHGADVRNVT